MRANLKDPHTRKIVNTCLKLGLPPNVIAERAGIAPSTARREVQLFRQSQLSPAAA